MSIQGAINRMWASAAIAAGLTQPMRDAIHQSDFEYNKGMQSYKEAQAGLKSTAEQQSKLLDESDTAPDIHKYLEDMGQNLKTAEQGVKDVENARGILEGATAKYWGNTKLRKKYNVMNQRADRLKKEYGEGVERFYQHGKNLYQSREGHRGEALDLVSQLSSTPGMMDNPIAAAQIRELMSRAEEIDEDMYQSQMPLIDLENRYNTYIEQKKGMAYRQDFFNKKWSNDKGGINNG